MAVPWHYTVGWFKSFPLTILQSKISPPPLLLLLSTSFFSTPIHLHDQFFGTPTSSQHKAITSLSLQVTTCPLSLAKQLLSSYNLHSLEQVPYFLGFSFLDCKTKNWFQTFSNFIVLWCQMSLDLNLGPRTLQNLDKLHFLKIQCVCFIQNGNNIIYF